MDALTWEGWLTLSLFGLVLVLLYIEWRPPYLTMLLGSAVLVITGILNPWEFIQGFANETLLTIAMVCIVVRAVESQGVVNKFATKILGTFRGYKSQLMTLLAPVSFISAFFNNTPVVLFLTPIVREWAIKNNFSPSKFLIPLSYASLMGGLCTLIGTSTNLVVQSMLVKEDPQLTFGFFELAQIGLPLLLVGYIYLFFFGNTLLPDRKDPLVDLSKTVREYTVEFILNEGSPLAGVMVKDAGFKETLLLSIDRKGGSIDSPEPEEILLENDRLVFAGTIKEIAHLHTFEGLQSQADPLFKLEVTNPHFAEIVIPTTSLFIGKTLKGVDFRNKYGASVFAIYRQGKRLSGTVGNIYLRAGDALMLLSNHYWAPEQERNNDFLVIQYSQRVPVFNRLKGTFSLIVLAVMVISAMFGVPIFTASLFSAFIVVITRSITIRECKHAIPWTLLLLIVSAIAFGKALQVSGAAKTLAHGLLSVTGSDPIWIIGMILFITIVTTELITNNAAVLLMFPLAVEAVQLAGYYNLEAIKTVGVAIAVAGSSGYALPTGYQTHLIVYGPGGYRFLDYLRIGLPLDVLVWIVATLLVPKIWGFV